MEQESKRSAVAASALQLALLWLWMRLFFTFPTGIDQKIVSSLRLVPSISALVVTAIVLMLHAHGDVGILCRRGRCAATGALGSVGVAATLLGTIAFSSSYGATALVVAYAGCALSSACNVLSLFQWGIRAVKVAHRYAELFVAIVFGALACFVMETICIFLPNIALVVLLSSVPLCSGLSGERVRMLCDKCDICPAAPVQGGLLAFWKTLPWGAVACCLALIWFEQFFARILALRNGGNTESLPVLLLCCAICFAGALAFWACRKVTLPKPYMFGRPGIGAGLTVLFWILFVFYFIALALAALLVGDLSSFPECMLVAASSCLRVYLLLLLICVATADNTDSVAALSVFTVLVLGVPLNAFVSLAFDDALLGSLGDVLFGKVLIMPICIGAIILMAVLPILLNMRKMLVEGSPDEASTTRSRTPDEVASELARTAGLSAREEEVLHLLVRGRTARSIADELCISPTTVVTHCKHIYKKVGVTSRTELLRVIEENGEKSSN